MLSWTDLRRAAAPLTSAVLLGAALAGCGGSDGADAVPGDDDGDGLIEVVLQTDWYAQPEHGGFYYALVHGLYRNAGLDVKIRPGANITNIPQMVATGRIEFAIGTSDNLIVAVARGIPLKGLFPYFQHDPQCVMFHESSGIDTLQDLDGRTVMMNPGLNYVRFLRQALGVDFELVPMDYGLARFLNDPGFVQQCFVTSEPYYVEHEGVDVGVIPLSRSGYDPYRLVYTSAAYLDARPDVVRAFVDASREGWRRYAAGDGAAVHERLAELNPQQTHDFMNWTKRAMARHGLVHGDADAGDRFGVFQRVRLREQIAQLAELGFLEETVSVEAAFALELQRTAGDAAGVATTAAGVDERMEEGP